MSANKTYMVTVVPPTSFTLFSNQTVTITAPQFVPSLVNFSVVSHVSDTQSLVPITLQAVLTDQTQIDVPSFSGSYTWSSAAPPTNEGITSYIPGPVTTVTAFAVTASQVSSLTLSTQSQQSGSGTISSTTIASVPTSITSTALTSNSAITPSTNQTASGSSPASTGSSLKQAHNNTAGIAGAAVGCFIAGVVVAGIIAFFMFRRKRSRHIHRNTGSEKEMSPLNGHGEAMYVVGGSSKSWKKHLPQSESDGSIRSMASRTLDQIELHVENFYVDVFNVPLTTKVRSDLQAVDSEHLPDSLVDLLGRSAKPTMLIKHCIADYIISRITFSPGNIQSFLPRGFLTLQAPVSDKDEGYRHALSQWRVLTSFLQTEAERDSTSERENNEVMTAAAKKLCHAFRPWARDDESTRLQSMIGIMKRAADLGVLLFSQSSEFRWQWTEARGVRADAATRHDPSQFVVLPGLYKMTDEELTPLSTPLHLLEPRLGSLSRT